MIYTAFLYPCKLCFQFTTLCYMHHTGEKESKKEKEKENNVKKKLLQGDSNPDPPSHLPPLSTEPPR